MMKQKKIIVPILTLAVMLLMVGGVYLCDEILREAQENEEENGIDLQ